MTRITILHTHDREAVIDTPHTYAVGDATPELRAMDRWGKVWVIPPGVVVAVEWV